MQGVLLLPAGVPGPEKGAGRPGAAGLSEYGRWSAGHSQHEGFVVKDFVKQSILARLREQHPDAVAELRFHPVRLWRFDFAIPSARVAVEVNGGVWTAGRHSRGSGLIKEYEKMRAAGILGWRVLPFATDEIAQIPAAVWAAVHHRGDEHQPTDRIRRRGTALERKGTDVVR
jgi:very-short-patch-repair endonuclease